MPSPVATWKFASSSGKATYETLLYDDGSLSCDCPGWTRRAERTCKHVREVDAYAWQIRTQGMKAENFGGHTLGAAAKAAAISAKAVPEPVPERPLAWRKIRPQEG